MENESNLRADLCIVGGGAAGITLAKELLGTSLKIIVLESGSLELENATQALYEGENVGRPYYELEESRLRFFGGTTNHWGRRCTPFDSIDFEKRKWVPYSGWPISRTQLDPYYSRAEKVCGLTELHYDDSVWEKIGYTRPDFDPSRLKSGFWQFARWQSFGDAYRDQLRASRNVKVILHANVTQIVTDDTSQTVTQLDLASLSGRSGIVRANAYVLATGGIENARLLLSSNKVAAAGVGNQNGLVGRFFMDHHAGMTASLIATDAYSLIDKFMLHRKKGKDYLGFMAPTSEVQEKLQILNCSALIDYIPDPESGAYAAWQIWTKLKTGEITSDFGKKLYRVLSDMEDVTENLYRRYVLGHFSLPRPSVIFVQTEGEHAPNPESRVTLSQERDQLGQNNAKLNWQLSEIDKRTVVETTKLIGAEFGRLGIARIKLAEWLSADANFWPEDFEYSSHHMGTTRMADNPSEGVVDANSQVHGVNNLYIAGSSVFPTYGHANPTFTIVALSIRLADHLKKLPKVSIG